jgi:hypothetical protein
VHALKRPAAGRSALIGLLAPNAARTGIFCGPILGVFPRFDLKALPFRFLLEPVPIFYCLLAYIFDNFLIFSNIHQPNLQ